MYYWESFPHSFSPSFFSFSPVLLLPVGKAKCQPLPKVGQSALTLYANASPLGNSHMHSVLPPLKNAPGFILFFSLLLCNLSPKSILALHSRSPTSFSFQATFLSCSAVRQQNFHHSHCTLSFSVLISCYSNNLTHLTSPYTPTCSLILQRVPDRQVHELPAPSSSLTLMPQLISFSCP